MNTKMKVLSLALVGAFGYVGATSAACPSDPVPPWSGKTQTGATVAIAAPGYDGTECRMTSTLAADADEFAAATVRDDSPANEPSYRAQFLINADELVNQDDFASVQVFSASSNASYLGTKRIVSLSVSGGASKVLNIITAAEGALPGNKKTTTATLAAGVNRVEIEWVADAATGKLNIWVNNTDPANPTKKIENINNAGWTGVDYVNLGLASPNNIFYTDHAGQAVSFDQFDSRRTTFIGH